MGKGLPRSHSRGDQKLQEVIKVDAAVNIASFVITDGAPGFGSAVMRALPEGNLLFMGLVANLVFTKGDADIIDAFDGDVALGTAPTADGTLSGAEVDLAPSTAIGPAVAGVTPVTRVVSTATEHGVILNNTDGSLELNLNIIIDDASISADSSMVVSGAVHLAFIVLGDD